MVATTRSRGISKVEVESTTTKRSTRQAQTTTVAKTARTTRRKHQTAKGNKRNGQGRRKNAKKLSREEEEKVAALEEAEKVAAREEAEKVAAIVVDGARQRCIDANKSFHLTEVEQRKLVRNVYDYLDKYCWPKDRTKAPFAPIESGFAAGDYYAEAGPKVEEGATCTLLLMGESPAATDPVMLGAQINHPRASKIGHANLMYSLSYGEPQLLDQDLLNSRPDTIIRGIKTGTLKYWRVKAALAGRYNVREDGVDPLSGDIDAFDSRVKAINGASAAERVEEKVKILDTLEERRILLIDSCVTPLYWPREIITVNGYKTPKHKFEKAEIIRESWKQHTQHLVEHHAPKKFVVLGKSVEKAIGPGRIENLMKAWGGTYDGCMYHPSSRELQSKADHIESLRYYRELGQWAAAAAGV